MSAECGKCGFDIVYPPGTWPVGECLNCKQNAEIDRLREALSDLDEALSDDFGDPYTDDYQGGTVIVSAHLRAKHELEKR